MINAGNLASWEAATLNIGTDLDLSSIPVSRWPDTWYQVPSQQQQVLDIIPIE